MTQKIYNKLTPNFTKNIQYQAIKQFSVNELIEILNESTKTGLEIDGQDSFPITREILNDFSNGEKYPFGIAAPFLWFEIAKILIQTLLEENN